MKTTLGFPAPGAKTAVHARFWRRALAAHMAMAKDAGHPGHARSILVAGPAANKGLYQDAASLRLDTGVDAQLLDKQTKAVEKLAGVLRRSTPNPDRQHPERIASLDALSPSLEAVLRADVQAAAPVSDDPEALIGALCNRLVPVVDRVVASTTPGSSLRRREAMARARSALDTAISEATQSLGPATKSAKPSPDAAKPKRTRKQKGDSG